MSKRNKPKLKLIAVLAVSAWSPGAWAQAEVARSDNTALPELVVSAEEELKQAPGVSVITAADLAKRPPANDLAEILRTQPGVNLTSAGATGSYGNQRQIDLRGMGAENTLILIDGKPVQSRASSQMRISGERDTGGDTGWVPADQIERIEIIRGPAAARYGSGAAGGVINIITKKPSARLAGSVTLYYSHPEHSEEGDGTQRLGFNLAGPLSDNLSFRLYGNVAHTGANSSTINAADGSTAAGMEGRRNRDLNAFLKWQLTPEQSLEFDASYSRQGNISAGEYVSQVSAGTTALVGQEQRRVYRESASLTHRAIWGELGDTRVVFQYENTRTDNCQKGTTGGGEGDCVSPVGYTESTASNYFLNGELHMPSQWLGYKQMVTWGAEVRYESLNDPNTTLQAGPSGTTSAAGAQASATSLGLYVEDNIDLAAGLTLTPGLRLDQQNQAGSNLGPSLNASYAINDSFTLKGGIARVWKTPNLYQTNPDYFWYSTGNGCYTTTSGCYIQGNADLDPEISVNKEIGLAWNSRAGWSSGLTYFRNDYQNKIVADLTGLSDDTVVSTTVNRAGTTTTTTRYLYQWYNSGPALIHGLEGNVTIPVLGDKGEQIKLIKKFTWMFSNNSKTTGQPISIIPKYTVNSTLDWHLSDQFSAQLTATMYGRQKPRSTAFNGAQQSGAALSQLGAYAIFGIGASYTFNQRYRAGFGITNLFDKDIKRLSASSGAGAHTYNEAGRTFYTNLSASF